ncbi:hypothetical protein HMPREF0776_0596 [Staphylococcus aureus subsp. aureus USA300_TCH959]|nr:hypothetical protein HMPREF0776_0596 [Staphylococcus aureus subsp. aureus USA300_TCH959]
MIKIQAIELYYGKSNFSMTLLIWLVVKMHFSKMYKKYNPYFLSPKLTSMPLLYIIAH